MGKHGRSVVAILAVVAWVAAGQQACAQGGPSYSWPQPYQQSDELTIEQQRKLGLSDEQILKIAEKRRDLEKERAKLAAQLKAAQEAAAAANAQVARLRQETQDLLSVKLEKAYESVMSEAQLKAWKESRYLDQAKQWLQTYKYYLKLSDAQVEDIAAMLVPVFDKYARMEAEAGDARERLAELRRAEKLDVGAIEKAEKEVAGFSAQTLLTQRQEELMDKMRAGLLPDQFEKFDRLRPRR